MQVVIILVSYKLIGVKYYELLKVKSSMMQVLRLYSVTG